MVSVLQKSSNRINAQKSTGPKSATGKRRAAKNARRHGVSAGEFEADVCWSFYQCIVGDPGVAPYNAVGARHHKKAMRLARCEALLQRVCNKLIRLDQKISGHLSRISERGLGSEREEALAQIIAEVGLPANIARQPGHWIFRYIKIEGDLTLLEPFRNAIKERRILLRYRAEAAAARSKALKHWLEADGKDDYDWSGGEALVGTHYPVST